MEKLHCLRVLFDSVDLHGIGKTCALHRDGSCSGSDIVENGIFREFQLCHGHGTDFHLCHRNLPAGECLIGNTVG